MTNEDRTRAIAWFEKQSKCLAVPGAAKMFGLAAEALNAMDVENEPLTMEKLRNMDGEPVWLKDGIGEGWFLASAIVGEKIYFCEKSITVGEPITGCGKTWLAYRRPPRKDDEA